MGKINKIEVFSELQGLIDKYQQKTTYSNNYMLLDEYRQHIDEGNLFFQEGKNNCILLLKKHGFYRLYYYINNVEERMQTDTNHPVVMEILYRGEANKPSDMMEYWTKCGFTQHLGRDMMAASIKKVVLPVSLNEKVMITYAHSEREKEYAYNLIKNTFDPYTGDILSKVEVNQTADNDEIFLATIEGEPCGILHLEIMNNVSWIGHIAVDTGYRKQGIANALVSAWIRKTGDQPTARYQLWVVQGNTPALKLYEKFGFVYANKSTISMLKK